MHAHSPTPEPHTQTATIRKQERSIDTISEASRHFAAFATHAQNSGSQRAAIATHNQADSSSTSQIPTHTHTHTHTHTQRVARLPHHTRIHAQQQHPLTSGLQSSKTSHA